jgi:hypothetical protein
VELENQFLGRGCCYYDCVSCSLLVLKKSVWLELHILAGLLVILMFGYLFLVLYYGVRFDRNEQYSVSWPVSKFETWWDATSQFNTGGTLREGGAEAGPLGIIICISQHLI